MRIAELTALHVRIPLRRAIRHASHTRTETDNVVVRCVLEDRTEGFGEGVPRDYVTGETIASAIDLLRRSDLGAQRPSPRDFQQAVTRIESIQFVAVPGDDRRCQGNAARCAMELALLDAYGRHFGQPLSAATQLLAPELYLPQANVRYSAAITSARGMKLRLAALAMRLYGFQHLKVKVGIAGYNDGQRLARIRRIAGRQMDIRVDANEAWSANGAAARILELEPSGISAIEQPVPHAEVAGLATVRSETSVPIMLDESLCSLVDAEAAVSHGTCDLFNLRLSKCGGFLATLRLAQFAQRHGIGYQLGCQVGETALLSAAGRHFASSVANIRWVEGSYDRHLVREALGTEDITFGRRGWAPALSSPGLGVSVDMAALERVTVAKESLIG